MFIYSKVLANTDIDPLGNQAVKPRLMLIMDSSGSMGENDKYGDIKIDAAKSQISKILGKIPDGITNVSLMAYDNCHARVLVPPSNTNIGRVQSRAMSIYPAGPTPIAKSIQKAGKILRGSSQKTTVILISDGQETCGGDPCAEVKRLKQKSNFNLKFYTVGYFVDKNTRKQLECIAKAGDGEYSDTKNSASLGEVFHKIVKKEVTKSFDEDADGVMNKKDRCPGTPRGFYVDKHGCEISYTAQIPFELDAIEKNPKLLQTVIKPLVNYLKTNKDKKVQIQGYINSDGINECNICNIKRYYRTMKVIKKQIVKEGGIAIKTDQVEILPPKKISGIAVGKTQPATSNNPLAKKKTSWFQFIIKPIRDYIF